MRHYRLALIFRSDIKKEKRDTLLGNVKKLLPGVKNEKVTELGEKKLAYPIKKDKIGSYVVSEFEAENSSKDLEKKLLMNEDVLRYLLVRTK